MKKTVKADLHFHPGFYGAGHPWRLTEWKAPTTRDVVQTAWDRGIEVLAITSCVNAYSNDGRWEEHMKGSYPHNFSVSHLPQGAIFTDLDDYSVNRSVYLFHGQEFKTDKLDVNVMFAERLVPRKESQRVPGKVDFNYLLDAARDSGDNVLIAVPPKALGLSEIDRGKDISMEELIDLYEEGKVDCLEAYNAMAPATENDKASRLLRILEIPGIAVSDGHRLADLGRSYTEFQLKGSHESFPKQIREKIRNSEFKVCEKPLSSISKGLYLARLAEAIGRNKISI